jgi:biopolymer transport protein ExbB/TolQ
MVEEAQGDGANLWVLGTIASAAPFIGLFGTVLGIIRAFRDLSTNMAEASQSVMAGIAEALLATALDGSRMYLNFIGYHNCIFVFS